MLSSSHCHTFVIVHHLLFDTSYKQLEATQKPHKMETKSSPKVTTTGYLEQGHLLGTTPKQATPSARLPSRLTKHLGHNIPCWRAALNMNSLSKPIPWHSPYRWAMGHWGRDSCGKASCLVCVCGCVCVLFFPDD